MWGPGRGSGVPCDVLTKLPLPLLWPNRRMVYHSGGLVRGDVSSDRLVGSLVGWLVGWLVGRLVG